MKSITVLLIIPFCVSFAQTKKHCSTPTPSVQDLNSLTKCTLNKKNDLKKGSELKILYRKVRQRKQIVVVQKKIEKGEIKEIVCPINQKGVDDSFANNTIQSQKLRNLSIQKVLFSVADKIPMFPDCVSDTNDDRACFNNELVKHFSNNFHPEQATDETISGKVFVQFTINFEGNITDIVIKSQKKSKLIEKEIRRTLSKLPKFTPGLHETMPVDVVYSLPINLNIE